MDRRKELIDELLKLEAREPLGKIKRAIDTFPLLRKKIGAKAQEHFLVLVLNGNSEIIAVKTVSIGTVNKTLVHPREVFRYAIMKNAVSVIVAHNHPSGNLEFSDADLSITERLMKAGEVLGIDVLDHIIVSYDGFISYAQRFGF